MSGRDLGASVRQRLLNQARSQGRPFQECLQYFAMERFLYRLTKSPFADRFILKGALLLTAWRAPVGRPTMDIDLAGKTNNELEDIRWLVGEVCEFATVPDGIEFTASSIKVQRIKEAAEYEGVRIRIKDYYDLALLARLYPFDGDVLGEAIGSIFRHRGTAIDATPVGLTEAFSADPGRAVQWRAFVRRSRFESEKAKGDRRISCQTGKMRLSPF